MVTAPPQPPQELVQTNREPAGPRSSWLYPLLVTLALVYVLAIGPTHLAEVGYRLPLALAVVFVGTWQSAQRCSGLRYHTGRSRWYHASSRLCAWVAHGAFALFVVLWQNGLVPFVATGLCLAGAVVLAEYARLSPRSRPLGE